jgi:hypothetical protein
MMEPETPAPDPATPAPDPKTPDPAPDREPAAAQRPRPILERIGMAFIALVLAALFAVVALAAFAGGEPFLGVMAAIGCLMVLWVGGLTLFKGR